MNPNNEETQKRGEKFVDDMVDLVRDTGAGGCCFLGGSCTDEAVRYALLKVELARSEAKLAASAAAATARKKPDQRQPDRPARYFTLRSLLGMDVISGWNLLALIALCLLVHGYRNDYFNLTDHLIDSVNHRCLISAEDVIMEMSRAPVNCEMCRELREMPVEHNMTKKLFLEKYAYTHRPVLIKNAIHDWKALQNFSLEFFRQLYDSKPESYRTQNDVGQFFPYKTEFATLREALHMSPERQNRSWYFGWANADDDIGYTLRQYYRRPDFLPDDAESSRIDWMFIGISAKGAQLHIDYVNRPSWQAQIKGRKIWEMVPTPECLSVCHSFNVTVHPGDIINLDTNRWYHATYVYPGDFSATIGSEYD